MTKLEAIEPAKRGENYRKLLHEHVDLMCDNFKDDMAGFIIAGWDVEMMHCSSYRICESSPFGLTFVPCFVQEIFRRHMAKNEADEVLYEKMGI